MFLPELTVAKSRPVQLLSRLAKRTRPARDSTDTDLETTNLPRKPPRVKYVNLY